MEKKLSTASTKTEILNAYNELLSSIEAKKNDNPRIEQERKIREETVKAATGISDEKIIGQISALKLALNTSLDKIEDDLSSEYLRLKKIREAISIEEQRLSDLYQINAGADSLAAIISAQKEKKAEFEYEMNEKKARFDEEIKAQNLAREKEAKLSEDKRKELEENIKKARSREEEEYQYSLQLARKKDKDQYEQKKTQLDKELSEKKLSFENEIKERELAVASDEKELSELRVRMEKFPAELEKAVQAAVKDASSRLEKEYGFEKQLQNKEHESELKLKSQIIDSLLVRIKDLELQVKQANIKADNAESNTKEITLKAIQSSGQIKIIEKDDSRRKAEE